VPPEVSSRPERSPLLAECPQVQADPGACRRRRRRLRRPGACRRPGPRPSGGRRRGRRWSRARGAASCTGLGWPRAGSVAGQHVGRLAHLSHVAVADTRGPDLPGLDRLGHGLHPGAHRARGVREVQVVEVDRFPAEPFQCPVQRGVELGAGNSGGIARTCWPPRPAGQPAGPLRPRPAPTGPRCRSPRVEKAHPIRLPPQRLVQAGLARLAGTPVVGANAERRHAHARLAQRPLVSLIAFHAFPCGGLGSAGEPGKEPWRCPGPPDGHAVVRIIGMSRPENGKSRQVGAASGSSLAECFIS